MFHLQSPLPPSSPHLPSRFSARLLFRVTTVSPPLRGEVDRPRRSGVHLLPGAFEDDPLSPGATDPGPCAPCGTGTRKEKEWCFHLHGACRKRKRMQEKEGLEGFA